MKILDYIVVIRLHWEKPYTVDLSENPLKLNDFPISFYANIFSIDTGSS